ncbi:MAG TPA: hypothetical protein VFW66_07870 [Gemmatimonadales bacterium]|nr:hypothetical protein [Gemmatimonadales bacterium]
MRLALAAAVLLAAAPLPAAHSGSTLSDAAGPYDIALFSTPTAPAARGHARLVYAPSPFGVAVTADGRARYDVQITASALPAPSTLGAFSSYVAWEVTPDLSRWTRLGVVAKGTSTVGPAELNKFLLVITAEADSMPAAHAGPTVLHGTSPSGWLQSFLTHPLFRGVAP